MATVVATAALLVAPIQLAPASATSSWLPGIDVSSWQGSINWPSVAGAGIKFVIAKATEGTTYADPTYATNKSGAMANGIAFTAYHFARPTSSTSDAIAQADYFLSNAKLSAGNLIPALDLEVTGGLGTTALQNWTWAWVKEVYARLGIKPMIYTSPYFWQTYMGNTTAFADAGYDTLWIAHWTTATSPSVPANNWGGHGWTFWQWSDCQHVSGISGCVDGDRYNGTDLTAVRITALWVSRTAAGSVASDPTGIACGSICKAYFDPTSTVTLSATPAVGATFLGWGGACAGTATCSVTMIGNKSVSARFGWTLAETVSGTGPGTIKAGSGGCTSSCSYLYAAGSTVTLTATPGPDALFSSWSGACTGTATTCVVSMTANKQVTANFVDKPPVATIVAPSTLTAPVRVTFDEPVFNVSRSNVDLRVTGTSTALSSSITCRGANGAPVDCVVGGTSTLTITPSAPLISGQHYTVTLDPSSSSQRITDDGALALPLASLAFRASRFEQEYSVGAAYSWQTVAATAALGGSFTQERVRGAQASFRFSGTGVTWYTQIGPWDGIAQVSVDGVAVRTVDLYANRTHYAVAMTFSGLSTASHVITITATGTRNASALGYWVSVDAFAVGTTTYVTPAAAYQWHPQTSSIAYGGRYVEAAWSGETARFTFRGTAIRWATIFAPDQGTANVYVDGRFVETVDNYSATLSRAVHGVSSLTDAVHTVSIVVLGKRDPRSRGTYVSVDAWFVS